MQRYVKLIGALVGNVVAIALAWAAVSFPALATCVPAAIPSEGATEVCSFLGFDQTEITAALMMLFNGVFIYKVVPKE